MALKNVVVAAGITFGLSMLMLGPGVMPLGKLLLYGLMGTSFLGLLTLAARDSHVRWGPMPTMRYSSYPRGYVSHPVHHASTSWWPTFLPSMWYAREYGRTRHVGTRFEPAPNVPPHPSARLVNSRFYPA